MWWGGHSFGYRLLIETLPAWAVLLELSVAPTLAHGRGWRNWALGLALGWSVLLNGLGARFTPSGFNQRLDADPGVLWSVRQGEIVSLVSKAAREMGFHPSGAGGNGRVN